MSTSRYRFYDVLLARHARKYEEALAGAAAPAPEAVIEGKARVAFREGETPGVLEIVSVDASGECVVHKVSGIALLNLASKTIEAVKRGATT